MTLLRLNIIVFCCLISTCISMPIFAASPSSGWNGCKQDSDCVLLLDPCGNYITTNATKVKSAKDWFAKNHVIYEMCTMAVKEKPAGARCGEYNVCEIYKHEAM